MPGKKMKGLIVYANNGSGFKSPACAIEKELNGLGVETTACDFLSALNLPVLDYLGKNSWRFMLDHPRIFDFLFKISNTSLMRIVMRLHDIAAGKALAQLASEKPDFILSTYPLATDMYARLVKRAKLSIPVFGYNSDAILSHKAYITKSVEKYFVSSQAGYNAMAMQGQPKEKLVLSGFPIDSKYLKKFGPVKIERKKLGLKDKFTLLLMSGGEGIGSLYSAVDAVAKSGLDIQVVVICGHNEGLRKDLEARHGNSGLNLVAKGFVSNVQDYLYCCDIVGGKSGLNFVFESMFMKKPFIVLKAMANEKFAARLIVRKKIGWWPETTSEFVQILKRSKTRSVLNNTVSNIKNLEFEFGAKKIALHIVSETEALRLRNLRLRNCILFDLAGTICDIPINSSNWRSINRKGIEKVLKSLAVDKILTYKEFRKACEDFVAEKARLREKAKKELKEFEIKNQLRNFLDKLAAKYARIESQFKENPVDRHKLEYLEELFISPELNISVKFKGADKMLEKLSRNHKLYLICNNVSSALVEKILEKEKLKGFFWDVLVSAQMGVRKPHKAFLDHVMKRIGASGNDCTIVGDRLGQDISMANKADIPCVHVKLKKHEDNKGIDSHCDFTANSISEIEKLFL